VEKAPETEHVEDTEKYEPEPEPEPEPEQKPAQIIESGRSSGLTPVPEPERDIDAPVTRKELGLVIQALLQNQPLQEVVPEIPSEALYPQPRAFSGKRYVMVVDNNGFGTRMEI